MLKDNYSSSIFLKASFLAAVLILSACSRPDESAPAEISTQATQSSKPSTASLPMGQGAPTANQGIVKTVHQAGGYSYIETEVNGSLFWIATAISEIKPGDKIAWNDYAIMNSFKSKALDKTFDQILFVDKIRFPSKQVASSTNKGTIIEFVDSAGYTYIQVKTPTKNLWLAAPVTQVSVGQTISWNGGAPMQNFSSRSLGRTFNSIIFVGSIQVTQG